MDHSVPANAIEIAVGEARKRVSKAGWIDDVGIQKRSKSVHALLKTKFFINLSKFVERLAPRTFNLSTVDKNVLRMYPAMSANFPVRNLLLVEKLHEMRP